MEKDFEGWHSIKAAVDNGTGGEDNKEREIWWISLGHNVGDEENGKGDRFSRPVLIVKGFSRNIFWGIPLTSAVREGHYYHSFTVPSLNRVNTALLSQMRILDTKRMTTKIGMIDQVEFTAIRSKLASFFT